MPHSVELIGRILRAVQEDYPADRFTFTFEKAIPGTRLYPDIFVRDAEGQACCAVEIGYTRPEKLTAYRKELRIPDVRWYDKAGNLHADVEEKVVKVRITTEPGGWFVVYRIDDYIECRSESCRSYAEAEVDPTEFVDTYEALCEIVDHLAADVCALLVTDYTRVWFACYCDKCGDVWCPPMAYTSDTEGIAFDLRAEMPRDFAQHWGGRIHQGDWKSVTAFAREYLGASLDYEDGDFLSREDARTYQRSMLSIRREAAQAN